MSQYTNSSGDIDPFEARLHFNSILKKITSSQQTIQTCTTFALRHHKYYEDLYRCIMEVMENATIMTRMNLFYFLDSLCVKSKKVEFNKYIEYIQRDLKKIVVDYVCERDDGCFNLVNTLKILSNWKEKSYFDISVIESTERVLLDWKKEPNYPAKLKLSKHDILKRIEEDRERAKHLREDIWWVDKSIPDGEALSLWEECSDLDKNDYLEILTENFKYQPDYPWLDVYKKVKLWNEEQKQLEEEELKARLEEEERARQKLEEEERERQNLEEEERERQKLEEEERERQKLEEEERARQKLEEEEQVRQKLEEEERARQKLEEEEERARQKLAEVERARQKLEEEERARQKLEEEERVLQKLEEEEQARQKLEEDERERQRLEEELKAQQKIEEEKERQLLEEERERQLLEERTRQEFEELKEKQQRIEREEFKEEQQLVDEEDHSFRSIGTKRQHCLDDILNYDVHEIKRLSKKARTQDYYDDDNHLVISADNCSDENNFNINEHIGHFSKSQGIDGKGYISQNDNDKPLEREMADNSQHNHSINNNFGKNINPISTYSIIDKDEESSLENKNEDYINEIQRSRMPFDPVRDAQNVDMNQDTTYSYTTSNTMPDDENAYNQQSLYSRPVETLEVSNNAETLVNEAIQPEECHIEQIAGSHLNLLMQAVGLLEAGVSSLPEDL
ncbi:CTD kinase subunit gamma CTK3-domain-containing protein [Gigaspora margarita]|uniref:CTD kinase subunit gamma CTK3-domain-containing protein n=1 Tax=Gigaspora margarita TaxID=4874 RepID=A0A8H3X8G4_GIGMA|nr:CTD kinase subunit gamma CTK3-domain-containing protein [Gigaspora margarita]